jgi:hypothetical protein
VEHVIDGKYARIVLDAVDPHGRYVDGLEVQGRLLNPRHDEQLVRFLQTGPGRYQAEFDAQRAGSYLLSLDYRDPTGGEGHAQSALNVSYSPEYRDLRSQRTRLEELASATGGRVLDVASNAFDRTVRLRGAREPIWQALLAWVLVLFFFDVLWRRVLVNFAPLRRAWRRITERKDRLEATQEGGDGKGRVSDEDMEARRRAALARPEGADSPACGAAREPGRAAGGAGMVAKPVAAPPQAPGKAPATPGYTERLLQAKRQAHRDRNKKDGEDTRAQ